MEGEAAARQLFFDGQAVPYGGPVRGGATVISRASDVQLADPAGTVPTGLLTLTGMPEDSLFLGAHYRHYIRLGDALVMADSVQPRPAG